MSKSPITCHVLDTSIGKPAAGIAVKLQQFEPAAKEGDLDVFTPIAKGTTNSDGRCADLFAPANPAQPVPKLHAGLYKIIFYPKEYFEATNRKCFYPWVEITFEIEKPEEHYHIPLLITPYSFTTYRGS
ncbi:Hydroxyisourate hydrolase [Dendrothele bispora CBS 962.96]|uniref:5-hydroxyisourate hydrolase n=1 Tax=Dendrothele bispora (strain CBS 962.96) TaxID=1314807 RepID=A0A4S8MWU2_DENBC|nr:Hydroxyisourate hydrolase [Dendrothele bispora CBS 962.96]